MSEDPLEKVLELEARIRDAEAAQSLDITSLKHDLKEVKESIASLIDILQTLKSFVKFIGYAEKLIVFVSKVSIYCAFMYGVYKFGIVELAKEVSKAGGK